MDKKMVCLFVDVELAREMMSTELESVRDLLCGYDPKIEEVRAAYSKLGNVLRCLEDIQAKEKQED